MTAQKPDRQDRTNPADPRAARLKAALKANIAKRKEQARARDGARPDQQRPESGQEQD